MAQNFTQLFVQFVFAVHHRQTLITEDYEDRLYAYISGIITNRKHTVIAINGPGDHVHILVRMHPTQSISDLVRDIKSNSTTFVNENALCQGHFEWQRNYGAFTYSKAQVPAVKRYVENQKEHHKKESFRGEFMRILAKLGIEYNEEYGFVWLD